LQRPTRLASAQRARAPCVGGARGRVKNRVGGLRLFKRLWTTYVQELLSRRTFERQRRRSLYAIAYKLRSFGRDRGLTGIGPTGACGLNPRQRGTRGPAGGLNRI
jgi:hypothetical protein